MASQTPDETTAGSDRITFEVDRMGVDQKGQLVVTGRWFGVRGRRFVRPTLTITMRSDGTERRSLADLKHKPWAAEDGGLWTAAFQLPVKLDEASSLELSVAPDIAVELTQARDTPRGRRARPSEAPDARAPRIRTDRVPARPSAGDREQEIDRLRTRMTAAERAAEREHGKREAAEQALEDERTEVRRLRSELGRLRSELDIAATTRTELAATSADLDVTRAEGRKSANRLQAAIRELDQQRAESERLQMQLAAAEATAQRLTQARETERRQAEAADQQASRSREDDTIRMSSRRGLSASSREGPPAETSSSREPYAAPSSPSARRSRQPVRPEAQHARPERPLNPSLRTRRNWIGRVLALIVILGVIAAIVLVIHSTMP